MKYLLLNQRGLHFVCLEDGTKIPVQVSATVQVQREKCIVTVESLCDERMGLPEDPRLRFVDGVLTYDKLVLDNAKVLSYKPGVAGPSGDIGRITFVVECELPDTIEQPKLYNK